MVYFVVFLSFDGIRLANLGLLERNAAKPVCRQAGFILFDEKFLFIALAMGINFEEEQNKICKLQPSKPLG